MGFAHECFDFSVLISRSIMILVDNDSDAAVSCICIIYEYSIVCLLFEKLKIY